MSVQGGEEGTLTLSLQGPQPDDAVIDDAGARVFIEHDAAPLVEDRQLDAQIDDQGGLSFLLGSQTG
jgi:Fe-S cluster assembly iron-binding protein IscA